MTLLVVGGGGREHAICWKLAKSPKVTELVCAPGNAGIAEVARCVDIGVMDFEKMADFAKKEAFDLVVVGPDDPLAAGLVDVLEEKGLRADLAAGFSLGEIVGDTLFTHIEKADRDYQGCYQMVVAQFAQQFAHEGVHFINREDDAGDPGLRTSKLSYHPVALLEKYTVTVDEPCKFCDRAE